MPLPLKKMLQATVGRALGRWSPAENIKGWMSRGELKWLRQQARRRHVIIEIGSWNGRSTYELASATPGILFFVEHFHGSHDSGQRAYNSLNSPEGVNAVRQTLLQNLEKFVSRGRALLVEMSSADAAKALAPLLRHRGADMIFIDGDHSYEGTKGDILAWRPILHPDGLLCGHDADWKGVRQALDEVLPGWQHGAGSIWYYPVRGSE